MSGMKSSYASTTTKPWHEDPYWTTLRGQQANRNASWSLEYENKTLHRINLWHLWYIYSPKRYVPTPLPHKSTKFMYINSYKLILLQEIQIGEWHGIMIINITKGYHLWYMCTLKQRSHTNYRNALVSHCSNISFWILIFLQYPSPFAKWGVGALYHLTISGSPRQQEFHWLATAGRLTQGASMGYMWATFKSFMMFHCTDGFIGILVMAYNKPYITG